MDFCKESYSPWTKLHSAKFYKKSDKSFKLKIFTTHERLNKNHILKVRNQLLKKLRTVHFKASLELNRGHPLYRPL